MSCEKISEPVGVQTRDVHEWRRSLRSPSPSGRDGQRNGRSRTPSPSRRGHRSLRSRSPSPSQVTVIKHTKGAYLSESARSAQKSTVANVLRKSTSNMADLSAALGRSSKGGTHQGANIEAEYIRNLQQQVYYLELESNYLREQARKATDTHPVMVKEADRMLSKLRLMQEEMDGLTLELNRRESSIGIISSEKERLQEQLRDVAEMRAKDKRMLMDEVITLKTEKDRMERDLAKKDDQLMEAKASVDKGSVALTNAETKIATLKAQLEQRVEQHRLTQLALEEKRTELVSVETQLRGVEEKYYSSTVTINDKVTQDLRDEICMLRQKLKETEMSAGKDRYLRDKINDDSSQLMRENAALTQRVLELEKQLDREKAVRESNDQRHAVSIGEMVGLKDKEGALRHELNQLSEHLRHEQERSKSYLEQLTNKETQFNKLDLRNNSSQSRISELESLQSSSQGEITQLKRDKVLLVEHVADLQKKIEEKDRALLELRSDMGDLDARLKQAQYHTSLELSAQSQKWEEFGRLADTMKSLSSSMVHATAGSPRSTRSKIPL